MFEIHYVFSNLSLDIKPNLIIIDPDDSYDKKISLKKLIFDTATNGVSYMIVFENNSLPSKENITKFINLVSKSIEIKSSFEIVRFNRNTNEYVDVTGREYIQALLNEITMSTNESFETYCIRDAHNEINTMYFEIFNNGNGIICMLKKIDETLSIYYDYCKDRTFFINFNNIELDV